MTEEKLKTANWQYNCHVAYTNCYIRSDKAEIDGVTMYRHITTRRNKAGAPVGSGKVTYSETMSSPDLSCSAAIAKMIELAKKQYS